MKRRYPILIGVLTALAFVTANPASAGRLRDEAPLRAAAGAPVSPGRKAKPTRYPRAEQEIVGREVRAGKIFPQKVIERRIMPSMRGMQSLGPQYDDEAKVYRLKFIRNGRVAFVDVDARTGKVLARSH